jgi:ABC-2 type transport system permease protein
VTTATTAELSSRPVPPLGGFSFTVLRLEIRRLLRNRRTVIFALVTPSIFFLLFGGNVSAFILISMALYGSVLATTSGGAMISIERAQGWTRQLRLTPLSPLAYVLIKMLTSMVLGFVSVLAVYIVGFATHKPSMPGYLWIVTALCVWIGALVFAPFGLFLGYLLPTENVMQFMGFIMILLAFGGGLFVPLSQYPHALQVLAKFTPLYGVNQLVHWPLTGGSMDMWWVVNAVAWLAIFTAGAIWRFRKDTARV